jgi:hypothetical protein
MPAAMRTSRLSDFLRGFQIRVRPDREKRARIGFAVPPTIDSLHWPDEETRHA